MTLKTNSRDIAHVVVVGAGIVGASAAYRLVRNGTNVTLVDQGDPGRATAAGAGIIGPSIEYDSQPELSRLDAHAVDFYPTLISQLAYDGELDTGYAEVGSLFLATSEDERNQLADLYSKLVRQSAANNASIGSVSYLTGADAQSLFPPLRTDLEAVHVSGGTRVDGRLLRDSLIRAVVKRGGTERHGAANLAIEGGRVGGVRIDGARVPADAVVVTAGAWSDTLGVALGIRPQRGQILHLELHGTQTESWPILTGFCGHYILTFPGGRVVAGATREDDTGYDYRVTVAGQRQLIENACHFAPGLSQATLVETRVGFRPMSPDGLPIIGAIPGIEDLFVANGFGSTGLTMGPFGGALVADLLSRRPPALDVGPYHPARFGPFTRR